MLSDSKRTAIELFLKAASFFECALRAVLPNTPEDIKYVTVSRNPIFLSISSFHIGENLQPRFPRAH